MQIQKGTTFSTMYIQSKKGKGKGDKGTVLAVHHLCVSKCSNRLKLF